jgi:hypothetical protein
LLLILIPIGWLAIVAFFVILCQAAARGDAAMAASAIPSHPRRHPSRRGLEQLQERSGALRHLAPSHVATRSRAHAGGAVHRRRPGCVTGG